MNRFLNDAGVKHPLICGAMFPCSNPELVAAASAAGALGVIQPVAMEFVHHRKLGDSIEYIRKITDKPLGMNIIVENLTGIYRQRAIKWVKTALDHGIRFFITSLGYPSWVVNMVKEKNGVVYHDVAKIRHAQKAVKAGIHGLICVNQRAGGHTGTESADTLLSHMQQFNLPLVCAGGIGSPDAYRKAFVSGYDAVQMGTRFIASTECSINSEYKNAIIAADESDIVLTDKISGVPVSVINNDHVKNQGTQFNPVAKFLLKTNETKHIMRGLLSLSSVFNLQKLTSKSGGYNEYFLAGRSVGGIHKIQSVAEIIEQFTNTPDLTSHRSNDD